MKKTKLTTCLIAAGVLVAFAGLSMPVWAEIPKELKALVDAHPNAPAGSVTRIKKASQAERGGNGVARPPGLGYSTRQVVTTEITTIRDLVKHINNKAPAEPVQLEVAVQTTQPGLRYLGQWVRDPYTTSLFFEEGNRLVMLNLENFKAHGSRLFIFDENQNAKVGATPAALGLRQQGARGLWVLDWIVPGDERLATLWVEDMLDAKGTPSRRPEAITALAEALLALKSK